uniref:Uncharacterized protein n=1 Tax=Solanum tuberosum TaxID=4113 RepID=M1DY99_SOLTU
MSVDSHLSRSGGPRDPSQAVDHLTNRAGKSWSSGRDQCGPDVRPQDLSQVVVLTTGRGSAREMPSQNHLRKTAREEKESTKAFQEFIKVSFSSSSKSKDISVEFFTRFRFSASRSRIDWFPIISSITSMLGFLEKERKRKEKKKSKIRPRTIDFGGGFAKELILQEFLRYLRCVLELPLVRFLSTYAGYRDLNEFEKIFEFRQIGAGKQKRKSRADFVKQVHVADLFPQ